MSESTVKERPILFSGPMVRAILEGRKTQTRRIVKDSHFKRLGLERDGDSIYTTEGPQWSGEFEGEFWCPYGRVGERLWVRETWAVHGVLYDDLAPRDIHASTPGGCWEDGDSIWFAADGEMPLAWQGRCQPEQRGKWRPSIHMPRWASRLTLEITGVRVERLLAISDADAIAEGVTQKYMADKDLNGDWNDGAPLHLFRELWESINGAGSWSANPWVWIVEFEKVTQ